MTDPLTLTLDELLDERAWLTALARSMLNDPASADDATQDTWLAAARSDRAVTDKRAWLATVLRHAIGQQRRKTRRRAVHETARPSVAQSASTAEVVARFETQRVVASAVDRLAEPFRTTVLLRYFEGLTAAEIARRDVCPAGTVRWRLHRAHELLRAELTAEHGDWRAALAPLGAIQSLDGTPPTTAATRTALRLGGRAGALAAAVSLTVGLGVIWWNAPAAEAPLPDTPEASNARVASAAPSLADQRADRRSVVAGLTSDAASPPAVDADTRALRPNQAAIVRARIVDPVTDQPIAGASLRVHGLLVGDVTYASPEISRLLAPAESRADGQVDLVLRTHDRLLALLPDHMHPDPGSPWSIELEFTADRRVPQRSIVRVADGDALDLGVVSLNPAARLTGRVVDADGRSVHDADICVELPPFHQDAETLAIEGDAPSSKHSTRTSGFFRASYELDGVPYGPAIVWAKKPGHRSAYALLDIAADEVAVPDLRLLPATTTSDSVSGDSPPTAMEVRVVTAAGEPASNAIVYYTDGARSGSGRVGPQGEFRAWASPNTNFDFWVWAVTQGPDPSACQPRHVDPRHGPVVLTLAPADTLRVRVEDANGRAIENPSIGWQIHGAERSLDSSDPAVTDDDGKGFAMLAPPAESATWTVRAPGHRVWQHALTTAELGDPLVVRLQPLHGVEGRVVAAGARIAGARIWVVTEAKAAIALNGLRSDYEREPRADAHSESDGSFRIDLESPGRMRLAATHDGYAPTFGAWHDYDPAHGVADVTLELSSGGSVSGTVRHADGRPAAWAIVAINGYDGFGRTTTADGAGRYRFDHLAPGGYEVRPFDAMVEPREWSRGPCGPGVDTSTPRRIDVAVIEDETTEHDISLEAATLSVRLRCAGRPPGAGWTARLTQEHDGSDVAKLVTRAGRDPHEMRSFAVGPHRLELCSPGGPLGDVRVVARVELAAGANHLELDLDLGPWSGDIPGAASMRWLSIEAEIAAGHGSTTGHSVEVTTRVHSGETFDLPLVPAGPVHLRARPAGGPWQSLDHRTLRAAR